MAAAVAAGALVGCTSDTQPVAQYQVVVVSGDSASDTVGHTLALPLVVRVTDLSTNKAVSGLTVSWKVLTGGGQVTTTSVTDSAGLSSTQRTLGTVAEMGLAEATVAAGQAPAIFVSFALPGPFATLVKVSGDSQTTGTLDTLLRQLVAKAADQYGNGVPGVSVHWTLTGSGTLIVPSPVSGPAGLAGANVRGDSAAGTATVTVTAGGSVDTLAFFVRTVAAPVLAAAIPIPPNYGVHDTFIRGGIAFVCIWNSGVRIYDVGNGVMGGSPTNPVLMGSVVPSADSVSAGPEIHNAWWFWGPTGEKKYLFLGQEGPGTVGVASIGDIHVIDVSDLTHPAEVAFFHLKGAGTHNFWMDEQHQILYAAYYNAGVVAIDVSGTLSGDISNRLIDNVSGGPGVSSYTWGVQWSNGTLYDIDMLQGLSKYSADTAGHLTLVAGGGNVPQRYSSDFSVDTLAPYAYSGSWDHFQRTGQPGSVVYVWHLSPSAAPTLVDTILTTQVAAISDVKVSPDGKLLMFSTETGPNSGFYFYSLANPAAPTFLDYYQTGTEGIHTAKWAEINGRLYAFGAKNPSNPELIILDVTSLDH